jgi:hypothetical protein
MADLYVKRAMFPSMSNALQVRLVLVAVVFATRALAQGTPDIAPKVIVVPFPGQEPVDAGNPIAQPPPTPALEAPPPMPTAEPVAPLPGPDATTRTFNAQPPLPPPPEQLDQRPAQFEQVGPTAMIDGHPREGAFLSGPGSFTFIMHHTLQTGLGVLATQMIPRLIDQTPGSFTNENARVAYLAGGLGGAAVGFAGSAVWQFTHWMSERTANFGIVNSFFGGMFLGGFSDLLTKDPYAISWLTLIGATAGGWLTAIVGGGDLALNKGALITTGGVWAAIYTALILGIVASTGAGGSLRSGMDAIMLTPAIGAAVMALATLKFNPSVGQIMRANVFGAGVAGAVLLISALILSNHFASPVPYILAGAGAIGAQTLVSLLWVEAAEAPVAPGEYQRPRVSVWW